MARHSQTTPANLGESINSIISRHVTSKGIPRPNNPEDSTNTTCAEAGRLEKWPKDGKHGHYLRWSQFVCYIYVYQHLMPRK